VHPQRLHAPFMSPTLQMDHANSSSRLIWLSSTPSLIEVGHTAIAREHTGFLGRHNGGVSRKA
jgi:hypothetical protein